MVGSDGAAGSSFWNGNGSLFITLISADGQTRFSSAGNAPAGISAPTRRPFSGTSRPAVSFSGEPEYRPKLSPRSNAAFSAACWVRSAHTTNIGGNPSWGLRRRAVVFRAAVVFKLCSAVQSPGGNASARNGGTTAEELLSKLCTAFLRPRRTAVLAITASRDRDSRSRTDAMRLGEGFDCQCPGDAVSAELCLTRIPT